MARGRPSFIVDATELSAKIAELESQKQFATQGELFTAVAETDWAKTRPMSNGKTGALSSQMVYLLCKKHNIAIGTKKAQKLIGTGKPRTPKNNSEYLAEQSKVIRSLTCKQARKTRLLKLASRAATGSKKAALRLHCLNCVGFENINVIGTKSECLS